MSLHKVNTLHRTPDFYFLFFAIWNWGPRLVKVCQHWCLAFMSSCFNWGCLAVLSNFSSVKLGQTQFALSPLMNYAFVFMFPFFCREAWWRLNLGKMMIWRSVNRSCCFSFLGGNKCWSEFVKFIFPETLGFRGNRNTSNKNAFCCIHLILKVFLKVLLKSHFVLVNSNCVLKVIRIVTPLVLWHL